MKSPGATRHKLKQVTFRHLQREIRTSLSCRPENCIHNRTVRLPTGDLRFCQLHTESDGSHIPCDENHGGLAQAGSCLDFQCNTTKEEVKEQFQEFLRVSDLGAIAARYPDIAALSWVLDEGGVEVPEDEPPPLDPPSPPSLFDWSRRIFMVPDGGPLPTRLQPVQFHRVIDYGITVAFPLR